MVLVETSARASVTPGGWLGIRLALAILIALSLGATAIDVKASDHLASTPASAVPPASDTVAPPVPVTAPPPPAPRSADALAASVAQIVAASGATVGVDLAELGGLQPLNWSFDAGTIFDAASTYKLAALMMEAQGLAAGTVDPNGLVYFTAADYEDGYFDDYVVGQGYSRSLLAYRAAHYSDNTAGHMLVRDVGGSVAVNAWAATLGATSSSFFAGNTTTAADLSALWVAEANGRLGGAAAQGWLYPLLTGTLYEAGIRAGTPGVTVVHKTGALDLTENDTALVLGLPSGPYVLTVMTDGLGETSGPELIALIASAANGFEVARSG
ncbi:MAG TPA: serine hydrolase [Candidatus Dormibacteraeota bacterium]|nr:serine hydrolase [Candidatus Dormibacteraeota bacterium]